MEKVAPNSKFVGHSTEIIRQSKIKGPLKQHLKQSSFLIETSTEVFHSRIISCFNGRGTTRQL